MFLIYAKSGGKAINPSRCHGSAVTRYRGINKIVSVELTDDWYGNLPLTTPTS
jgi:hypothetical protein